MERARVHVACAFVDQRCGEGRQPGLARRIVNRTRRQRRHHRNDRDGVIFRKPHFGILAEVELLEFGSGYGRGHQQQRANCD